MKCVLAYLCIWQFPEENNTKMGEPEATKYVFPSCSRSYYSQNASQQTLHIQTVIVNAESFIFGLSKLIVPEDQI